MPGVILNRVVIGGRQTNQWLLSPVTPQIGCSVAPGAG